ncbi:MAG: PLP-dependent aminotransferase family protein [Marinosulfonomonas sp.]|nr:PLP-dependent aminotransferase family protein [Marinosulfonomonas sp.]
MASVRNQIASRQIASGAKLPSIRALSQKLGVSKSTVVDAYDRLVAEGAIQSRRGSGFFVSGHLPPLSLANIGPSLQSEIDPLRLTRQSLAENGSFFKPGCGWLPASWMPEDDIRRALRSLARASTDSLSDYGTPQGLPALRHLLTRRFAEQGVQASPNQVMLTESGTQALDLVCRFFLEPGDTVLVDDPCYFNFHALLKAHRVNVVSTPYTATGPDLKLFEQTLVEHAPRLYITNSAVHNPTGAMLSPLAAHRVLRLAEQHDLLIVEDDIFADFEHQAAPRLAAFDGLQRVIHIGSFSKTLSASIRCGYIAARQDWVDEIVDLKLATSFGGGAFSAELTLHLLQSGAYRKHVGGLRTRLAGAMGTVSANLKAIGLKPWIQPNAGMFLWCELPKGLDSVKVAQSAYECGIVLAPGNAFSHSQTAASFLRFNVAQTLDPKIISGLERLMNQMGDR